MKQVDIILQAKECIRNHIIAGDGGYLYYSIRNYDQTGPSSNSERSIFINAAVSLILEWNISDGTNPIVYVRNIFDIDRSQTANHILLGVRNAEDYQLVDHHRIQEEYIPHYPAENNYNFLTSAFGTMLGIIGNIIPK